MKRKTEIYVKAVAFMQVAAVACTGLTETVSWQGGGGVNAWETEANWSTGTIPDADSVVWIDTDAGNATISASTELPKFHSLFLRGSGAVAFELEPAAKMTTGDGVTNFCSAAYAGGFYEFGDELVVGYAKGWLGDVQSSGVRAQFTNCRAAIGGRILVTGYSGNGLDVSEGAFVTSAGYLDSSGIRNVTRVRDGGVYQSTGDMVINDFWSNDAIPEAFVVDGGAVTNAGALKIAYGNAGRTAVCLRNGSSWRQQGNVLVGCANGSSSVSNSLQILSGSKFVSEAQILMPATEKTSQNFITVEGKSALDAQEVWIGGVDRSTNSWLAVNGESAATIESLYLGAKKQNSGMSFVASGGATVLVTTLKVGGSSSDHLSLSVSNAQFTVQNPVALPADTSVGNVSFVLSDDLADGFARADFRGGLILGAGIKAGSATRTASTVLRVEGGRVTVGAVSESGATSGDVRIGALDVAGESDKGTNRLEIAGAGGCFTALHRMMAAGCAEIVFHVPDGGYQGAFGCGLYGKNFYLENARIVVDVSQVATDGTYVLARATDDLRLKEENISLVATEKQKVRLSVSNAPDERFLRVTVKRRRGLAIIIK